MEQIRYQTGYARYAAETDYPEFWDGLVGCWMPPLGPTGWTLFDLGPYKKHGTLTNMDPATDWVGGKFGNALNFNGVNGFVDVSTGSPFALGQLTVSMWMNRSTSDTGIEHIIGCFISGSNQWQFAANYSNAGGNVWDTYRFLYDADGAGAKEDAVKVGTGINQTGWHLLTATRDTSNLKFYIDGIEQASVAVTAGNLTGTPTVEIGRNTVAIYAFTGLIDNVLIYNRGLTAQEIQRLYSDPFCFLRRRKVTYFVVPTGAYLIAADAGSYSLTGQAVTLQRDGTIDLAAGSYSLTGQTATPLYNRQITAAPAAYNLTGQEVTLTRLAELVVDTGSYTLTGQDLDLFRHFLVSAEAGAYNLTGQDLDLIRLAKLVLEGASYTIAGQDVDLFYGTSFTADAGAYNITGQTVDLTRLAKLVLETGSYTLTGQDLDLLHGFLFPADAGSYSITGQDVDLIRLAKLLLEAGSYTLTGQDVDLQKIIPHIIPQIMHYLRMKH